MPKPRKSTRPLDPNHESSDEDEGEEGNKLTAMLETAMEKQQEFMVAQFAGLNGRLDEIKTEMSRCTKDVAKLRTDYSNLRKRVNKTENTIKSNKAKLADYEAKLADLEDRNWIDNMRILGIPEGAERPNASQFISTNLPKWFPNMGEQWLEITERTASALRLLVTEIFGRQYAKCSASPTGTKYSRLRGERLSSSRTDRYASPPTSATIW